MFAKSFFHNFQLKARFFVEKKFDLESKSKIKCDFKAKK